MVGVMDRDSFHLEIGELQIAVQQQLELRRPMVMRLNLASRKARTNQFRPLTAVEADLDFVFALVCLPRDLRKIDYDFLGHEDLLCEMLDLWPRVFLMLGVLLSSAFGHPYARPGDYVKLTGE
jgi:hypothetical protein